MPGWVRGTPLQLCEGAQKPSSLCKISREKCGQGWSDPERTVCPADVACGETQQAVTEGSGRADVRIHRAGKWGPGMKPGLCRLQGSRTSSPQGFMNALREHKVPPVSEPPLPLCQNRARRVFQRDLEEDVGFLLPPQSTQEHIQSDLG